MRNDYDRWKKRRDAERERAAQAGDGDPALPHYGRHGNSPEDWYDPRTGYAPRPAKRSKGGSARGCAGCLVLLVGALALAVVAAATFTTLYWRQIEQRGQVNVLLLGTDERSTEPGPFRSDTMILAGFDPREEEVVLLSIPRDLWVTIDGQGENRINTAHFFGGPTLARQTVAQNFGIPLHYYVKLNFDGFVSIVDAIGGITVDVPEALHDENYPTPDYGVTTIDIPAGVQQMDGATALIYARSRYSTSDFDRSQRQQQIIEAVRERLSKPETWLLAPAIFTALRDALETDIPLVEWPALAFILMRSDVERTAIGPEATEAWVTPEGGQVLLPLWEQINPVLARYFE